jgi:hypothetical protein
LKKNYARYIYNRGLVVLWKGDPAEAGAIHRSIALVTDAFNSIDSRCQVYELEGVGKGVTDGKFAGTEGEPTVRFDKDFDRLEEGAAQGKALVKQAEAEGFRQMTIWDQIEFEERARKALQK